MAKTLKYQRKNRNNSRSNGHQDQVVTQYMDPREWDTPRTNPTPKPLAAKTEAQGMLISAMMSSELVFAIGPAGTGKTYVAGAWAADKLIDRRIDRIIVTRPAIE